MNKPRSEIIDAIVLGFVLSAFVLVGLMMTGCATEQVFKNDVTKANYKSLKVTINDQDFYGVGVVPKADKYDVIIKPQTEAKRVSVYSCHIDKVFDPDEIKEKKELLEKGIVFPYVIQKRIEDKQACLLDVKVMNQENKAYEYASFDFLDTRPHVQMPSTTYCNGEVKQNPWGASMCQAGADTFQAIEFPYVSNFTSWDEEEKEESSSGPCFDAISSDDGKWFEISVIPGKCVYYFTATKKFDDTHYYQHRLTVFGVSEYPFRE